MSWKISIFQGWFIGSTLFTCGALGDYLGGLYFSGSRVPWMICMVVAMVIIWRGGEIIKGFVSATTRKQNDIRKA